MVAARIVAVVDVWDELTSDRAYRAARPPDRALPLEAGRGTHFDPRCLDASPDGQGPRLSAYPRPRRCRRGRRGRPNLPPGPR